MKTFNNLDECIQEIKRLRIQVDALIQIANEHKTSAETTLAWRELQLAKAWLGKLLGDVSKSPSPYVQVRKTELIPATTKVAELAPYKFDTPLDMCNSQRNIIEDIIVAFEDMYLAPNLSQLVQFYNDSFGYGTNSKEIQEINEKKIYYNYDYWNLVRNHFQQARFWYGFEIANLRTV